MNIHNVPCDLYIGTKAGTALLQDIAGATESIHIVSPYLSATFVDKLIQKHSDGVLIDLFTTDASTTTKAFQAHGKTVILPPKKRRSVVARILYILSWLLVPVVIGWAIYSQDPKVFIALAPLGFYFLWYTIYKGWTKKRAAYKFSQLFPFRLYKSKKNNGLVHSKIYVIDQRVAYLGSLNFTQNGTSHSFETHIRTEDPDAIESILKTLDELKVSDWETLDIQEFAESIYRKGDRKRGKSKKES